MRGLKTLSWYVQILCSASCVFLAACASVPSGAPDTNGSASVPPVADSEGQSPDQRHSGGAASARTRETDSLGVARSHMDRMTRRERIAQRFITFVPRGLDPSANAALQDDSIDVDFVRMVSEAPPAGFILYPWNYEGRDDLIELTDLLQSMADRLQPGNSFLISADQEGGRVAAFRFPDMVRVPSAADVARHDNELFVQRLAYVLGIELISMGVNMNLAPVLDLVETPDGSIIGDRSWGDDPDQVSRFASASIRGFRQAGLIATAKHFPGHGVTRIDSHGRLPVVEYRMEDLIEREVQPFAAAIEAGVPAVMTAHILFPQIDNEFPVTLSSLFVNDLLRQTLGFDGVVISDGLEMGALRDEYDLDTTLQRAIYAGIDLILLYDQYRLSDVVDRVEHLIGEGRITMEDIDRGVERILLLKAAHGLLN